MEGFYQESGRAGRDRNNSISVLYYAGTDRERNEFLMSQEYERQTKTPQSKLIHESNKASFQSLVNMCEKPKCRRRTILEFFAEKPSFTQGCGNCDFCTNPQKVTKLIKQILNGRGIRHRYALYVFEFELLLNVILIY